MAKQTINIGAIQNDGTGTPLRDAGDLINDNFNEIYSAIGDGTNLTSAYITDSSTDTLLNKTFDANGTGNSITNIEVADLASGVLDTDLTTVSSSHNTLASAKAIKTYVDNVAAAGIHYHDPVRVEAVTNLTANYVNGSSGVGATLTNTGTLTAITIDGITLSLNDRVLVYNQTNAAHNGIYTVTTVGNGSTAWVLTRATDADSYGISDPDALGEGDAFFVREGNTGSGELYVMNTEGTITFGTTNINFSQISTLPTFTGGDGIDITGTIFSVDYDNITINANSGLLQVKTGGITSTQLASNAVTTDKILADAINGTKIADDSINSEHYVDGSIDTQHIGNLQITSAKIADSNVTASKIAADAINGTKIADDSINSEHYVDGSIDNQHIANSTITSSKLSGAVNLQILSSSGGVLKSLYGTGT